MLAIASEHTYKYGQKLAFADTPRPDNGGVSGGYY